MDITTEEEARLLKLYEMRTSMERRYTLKEQAEALGVSVSTIQRMVRSREYQRIVAEHQPQQSPMVDIAREHLVEHLLPLSLQIAQEMLENPKVSPTAKVNLINSIWRQAWETQPPAQESELLEVMEHLRRFNAAQNVNIILMNAPQEYQELLRRMLPAETIEGEATPVDHDPGQ